MSKDTNITEDRLKELFGYKNRTCLIRQTHVPVGRVHQLQTGAILFGIVAGLILSQVVSIVLTWGKVLGECYG